MSAEKFKQLHRLTRLHLPQDKRYSSTGKILYPFAKLPAIGIKNYTALKKAYRQVVAKTSPYTRSERNAITYAYELCRQQSTAYINIIDWHNYQVQKQKINQQKNTKK